MSDLKAPFPWFGGKSRCAHLVWERFGNVPNYVEPFFGSGAVLLGRPHSPGIETVNDLDGFVCNAWRSIALSPEETVRWADCPAFENDLHARHVWLRARKETLVSQLEADPEYHDPKIAGWWLWGMSQWIGTGFCGDLGAGPWSVVEENGERRLLRGDAGRGVSRQLPHLGDAGQGVKRQLPHLGAGRGVSRKLPHLGDAGRGVSRNVGLLEWFEALSERMRRVRVCCGDWERVCGPTPTTKLGITGVFLDPPYSDGRAAVYNEESFDVAHRVRAWCVARCDDPKMRIALCGYDGEHDELESSGWTVVPWKAKGGYGSQRKNGTNENAGRERIWFSPHCLKPSRNSLP